MDAETVKPQRNVEVCAGGVRSTGRIFAPLDNCVKLTGTDGVFGGQEFQNFSAAAKAKIGQFTEFCRKLLVRRTLRSQSWMHLCGLDHQGELTAGRTESF